LVWTVENTRWPVSAARIAISAVSRSRISPTIITSGSWRRNERKPDAKVRPFLTLTCTWLMPASEYSTGSSIVRQFFWVVSTSVSAA
jgi:predicted phage gp36 major capsid-like protein